LNGVQRKRHDSNKQHPTKRTRFHKFCLSPDFHRAPFRSSVIRGHTNRGTYNLHHSSLRFPPGFFFWSSRGTRAIAIFIPRMRPVCHDKLYVPDYLWPCVGAALAEAGENFRIPLFCQARLGAASREGSSHSSRLCFPVAEPGCALWSVGANYLMAVPSPDRVSSCPFRPSGQEPG